MKKTFAITDYKKNTTKEYIVVAEDVDEAINKIKNQTSDSDSLFFGTRELAYDEKTGTYVYLDIKIGSR